MKRLRWLTAAAVAAIHEELIARYGGRPGLRAAGLLESAVARPQNVAAYKRTVTAPGLAAAYGWRLLRNHPFVDGNKRIALAAMVVFLDLNGWELGCSQAEETAMLLKAAAGELSESAWRKWSRAVQGRKPDGGLVCPPFSLVPRAQARICLFGHQSR